jgi:hypothetical protein
MNQRYDPSSNWGLTECKEELDNNGKYQGKEVVYSSFPKVPRAFPIDTGYIQTTGEQ